MFGPFAAVEGKQARPDEFKVGRSADPKALWIQAIASPFRSLQLDAGVQTVAPATAGCLGPAPSLMVSAGVAAGVCSRQPARACRPPTISPTLVPPSGRRIDQPVSAADYITRLCSITTDQFGPCPPGAASTSIQACWDVVEVRPVVGPFDQLERLAGGPVLDSCRMANFDPLSLAAREGGAGLRA